MKPIIKDRQQLVILVLCVLPITGVLLSGLSFWQPYSYWLDELYSITTSSLGFTAMFKSMLIDVHPPLYQVLLWFWIRLFSDYEPIVRGFSLICAVSAVCYLYRWGKKIDTCTRLLILTFLQRRGFLSITPKRRVLTHYCYFYQPYRLAYLLPMTVVEKVTCNYFSSSPCWP
jgi:hypothetical protein